MSYNEFIASKQDYGADNGFEPLWIPDFLFDFQVYLTEWAIRKGRAAIFADCGMGKTPMQLVWAQNVIEKTGKPVLILTPLSVGSQTIQEADKFGIEAVRALPGKNPLTIQVTNYERLHYYNPRDYGGIVCDESSILKQYGGTRSNQIIEFMRTVKYRLLCTATAAPNDWEELGTSSEALGHYGRQDMISKFFTHKQPFALTDRTTGRDKFYLRPHAAKGPFWQWVASWARAARRPSDLGFDDDRFILPEMIERHHKINPRELPPGMMFDVTATNWNEERSAIRRSIPDRCEKAAELVDDHGSVSMVWCHLNDESSFLASIIPNSIEITGSSSDEEREEAVDWFVNGTDSRRVLISKPKIFGFGMNFQHCSHMTYFPSHSYEQYYQATRRLWRFGQNDNVKVDLVYTNGGRRIMENLARKAVQADEMFDNLVYHMNNEIRLKRDNYQKQIVEVPQWLAK